LDSIVIGGYFFIVTLSSTPKLIYGRGSDPDPAGELTTLP